MDPSKAPRWNTEHVNSGRPAGLQLDPATLRKLKDQALAKARKLQEKVALQPHFCDHVALSQFKPRRNPHPPHCPLCRQPNRLHKILQTQNQQCRTWLVPGMPRKQVLSYGYSGGMQREVLLFWHLQGSW